MLLPFSIATLHKLINIIINQRKKIVEIFRTIKVIIVLIFCWLLPSWSFGQIGINTENPQSTLDVEADDTNAPAGIIAPRQTRQQLIDKATNYTVSQRGAIVYVTDVSGGTSAATAIITRVGYYYFDGNLWQRFSSSSSGSADSWSFTGNNGLSAIHGDNFVGTTDAVDIVLKTNAVERMTVSSSGNVGIGIAAPTHKLHVKDASDPMKVEGLAVSASSSDLPLVVGSDGVVRTGVFPSINIVPDDVGTVIVIEGKLRIAQEIAVLMTADFAFPVSSSMPVPIGNLTNVIVDNENFFNATTSTNSFTVEADGVYLVNMNAQLATTVGTKPFVGIWSNTDNAWVAGVNDIVTAALQTYTLATAINLYASKTYSLRVGNTSAGTIPWKSSGYTGEGPISFYTLKRLK